MGATAIEDDSDRAKMGTMVASGGFHTVTAMAKENIFKTFLQPSQCERALRESKLANGISNKDTKEKNCTTTKS